jgi:hypothetical protein
VTIEGDGSQRSRVVALTALGFTIVLTGAPQAANATTDPSNFSARLSALAEAREDGRLQILFQGKPVGSVAPTETEDEQGAGSMKRPGTENTPQNRTRRLYLYTGDTFGSNWQNGR